MGQRFKNFVDKALYSGYPPQNLKEENHGE
jgi:hypothetical protein